MCDRFIAHFVHDIAQLKKLKKKTILNHIESQQIPGTTVDEKCIDSEGVDEMETDDSTKKKVKKNTT